jgi:hypothetical protein
MIEVARRAILHSKKFSTGLQIANPAEVRASRVRVPKRSATRIGYFATHNHLPTCLATLPDTICGG